MAIRRTLRLKTREQRELEHYRDHDGAALRPRAMRCLTEDFAGSDTPCRGTTRVVNPRDPDTLYGSLEVYAEEGLAGLLVHQHGGDHRRLLRGGRGRAENCWRRCAPGAG